MRKVFVIAVTLILLGVVPLMAAGPKVLAIPRSVPANGGQAAGALATLVAIEPVDPDFNNFMTGGVPCFNCVPSGLQYTLGLGIPLNWVSAGSSMAVILLVDNYSYTGVADFIYSITVGTRGQGGKVVASGSVVASVYPSNWVAYFPITVPSTPGRYTLDGIFDAGGHGGADTSAVTTPLIIQ